MQSASSPERRRDIELVRLSGDGESLQAGAPQALFATAADEINARFSPDGRWLAYASDQSGVYRVYVLSMAHPESRWQVSAAEGFIPPWSPKTDQLFFRELGSPDDVGLMVASYSTTGDVFVPGSTRRFTQAAAAPDLTGQGAPSVYSVGSDGRVLGAFRAPTERALASGRSWGLFLNAIDTIARKTREQAR
jgi:Tol biopolymer transport system component